MKSNETLSKGSRRTFLQLSAAATAAMAFRISTEASLAAEERKVFHPGAVVIDANENPLGPCDAARKAIVDMAPQGGRYSYWLKEEFVKTFTEMEGLKPEYLRVFPGSSEPVRASIRSCLAGFSVTKSSASISGTSPYLTAFAASRFSRRASSSESELNDTTTPRARMRAPLYGIASYASSL